MVIMSPRLDVVVLNYQRYARTLREHKGCRSMLYSE